MTKHKEVLELALDTHIKNESHRTVEESRYWCDQYKLLAQPEQEPVAVVETIGGYPDESAHVAKWLVPYKSLKAGDKLYTTPPQRKPLTDEQIRQIMQSLGWTGEAPSDIEFARAIEAAHGIKGDA